MAFSQDVAVVASIKPVHSIVSAVMAGVGRPYPVMRNSLSHHGFNMRPSDAAVLQEADVIFLIDDALETGLAAAINNLAPGAQIVELSTAREGRVRRRFREGGGFETDPHHSHDGDHDHGHGHELANIQDDDGHGHGHAEDSRVIIDEEEGTGPWDLHIWLDPVNAEGMAHLIADTLSAATPENFERHEENARNFIERLRELTEEIAADLNELEGQPFIVFHDGYQYFEKRFGLNAVGSTVVSPEQTPSIKRIREIQGKIRELDVVCVISEPAFDGRMVNTVIEGTSARAGSVDAMGALIDAGPELYFTLLNKMAAAFKDCLAPS
ncbi:MAG: zinc ABC transporter substrate-binding protein [Paracoccaceae bacterium]|nr:zinc ABC transporter substrate-binding protein [Paracoccaceae bacterium]